MNSAFLLSHSETISYTKGWNKSIEPIEIESYDILLETDCSDRSEVD